jgi:hypothetical protein
MAKVIPINDVTQNVYGKSWWEERVEAVTRAVEAVSVATENAEKAEAKPDQPETFSEQWVPLWLPRRKPKLQVVEGIGRGERI